MPHYFKFLTTDFFILLESPFFIVSSCVCMLFWHQSPSHIGRIFLSRFFRLVSSISLATRPSKSFAEERFVLLLPVMTVPWCLSRASFIMHSRKILKSIGGFSLGIHKLMCGTTLLWSPGTLLWWLPYHTLYLYYIYSLLPIMLCAPCF